MRWIVATTLTTTVLLCGCADVLGNSCTVPGVMNDEVATLQDADECDGGTCMYYEGFGSFCTDSCAGDGDCPNGMECAVADMDPTPAGVSETSTCIPDEPIDPGDDDDSTPIGVPPEISELRLWGATDVDSGACIIHHEFVWHDDDGDLNGAIAYIEFVLVDDPEVIVYFSTTVEQVDTTDTTLHFLITHDGSNLGFATRYNVLVDIEDRAGNMSNQLAEGGYETPDANCD